MLFAVLCTGPSMSQDVANSVRNLHVIAVNGAYEFAPWADALAAQDVSWWRHNPKAIEFAGRKFSGSQVKGVERVQPGPIHTGICSGVLALEVAKKLGATKVLLLGADMHGSHYFGDYKAPLSNTKPERRGTHAVQFRNWGKGNPAIKVINCTPGSALTCFPMARLEDVLCQES